ncbi:MAG: TetR/AcrR family transcriptional regulator [Solirubrobacterales bacterium]
MPKLRPQVRSERRQAILDAAWRCAARKPFGEMTVDEVCAEGGLSKGAFYGYFESKDALLEGLLEDDAAALDAMLDEIGAGEPGGIGRLRHFARAMLEHADDPGRAQVRADLWAAASSEPALREHFAATGARRRAQLRHWIEESIAAGELREAPANALASLLLAMADGLMLHASIDPGAFRWANVRRAVDELLSGITSA